jgi:hypothetical protein
MLIENYIRSYLIKESINLQDNEAIEEAISNLNRKVNIDNLSFNSYLIVTLRDNKPIKSKEKIVGKKPESLSIENNENSSEVLNRFKLINPFSDFYGLGFNPFDKLGSKNKFYVNKIKELINIYENIPVKNVFETEKHRKYIDFLKSILEFKNDVEESGLVILGAGINRIALSIPEVENVVIKIGLSEKGRKDNLKEINFGMSRGEGSVDHVSNFPTVYNYSDTGSWYAIEKVLFLYDFPKGNLKDSKSSSSNNKFNNDVRHQFINAFYFFKKLEMVKYVHEVDLFREYIRIMFSFDSEEIKNFHAEYESKINKKTPFLKNIFSKFFKSINKNVAAKKVITNSPQAYIFNSLFKEKLVCFLEWFGEICIESYFTESDDFLKKSRIEKKETIDLEKEFMKDLSSVIKNIKSIDDKVLSKMSQELNTLIDQALITGMRDLHGGNLGFKKTRRTKKEREVAKLTRSEETENENSFKWRLIFTDIDSN